MSSNQPARRKLQTTSAVLVALVAAFTLYEELSLRRWLFHRHGISAIIAGSFPNFLAVLLFSFAILFIKLPETRRQTIQPIAAVVIGLTAYEIAQIWMPSRVFDWYDLAASFLGGLGCYAIATIALTTERKLHASASGPTENSL